MSLKSETLFVAHSTEWATGKCEQYLYYIGVEALLWYNDNLLLESKIVITHFELIPGSQGFNGKRN
jgi:hypothetical protein